MALKSPLHRWMCHLTCFTGHMPLDTSCRVVDVYDAYLNGVAEAWCSGAEDLIWATSLVESRAFEGPPGPLGRVQLVIPFVDMANHCEAPNAHQRMVRQSSLPRPPRVVQCTLPPDCRSRIRKPPRSFILHTAYLRMV